MNRCGCVPARMRVPSEETSLLHLDSDGIVELVSRIVRLAETRLLQL